MCPGRKRQRPEISSRWPLLLGNGTLPPAAQPLAKAIRWHWAIENTLYGSMDVTFGEDHHRLLDRSGVCNLSALRRLCVSIF